MNSQYAIHDTSRIFSPGLVFFKDLIRRNVAEAIRIAGSAGRLRPHVKTHKTRQIVELELAQGITKHKCATVAEAEMVARAGAPDVLLAYPLVGPNCARFARLVQSYPACQFTAIADHPASVQALSSALLAQKQEADVLIDVDVGQQRTGIAAGPAAEELYELIQSLPGVRPGGFHVYDGHNHQDALADRETAVREQLGPVLQMRESLLKKGLLVPRLVLGGTPTFPVHARMDLPGIELSPGTCFLHDEGYGGHFLDMNGFVPAALLLTRVVSKPSPGRLTLDLGYKAVASDPPAEKRCRLLDLPDARIVLQNEEHLVVETAAADRADPGDVFFAVPYHICPTCALHRFAYVIEGGNVVERWDIVARDRELHVA
ncbi:MAG: D-TA family PLP-dependent enzyme [Gemmataceae bacterium]